MRVICVLLLLSISINLYCREIIERILEPAIIEVRYEQRQILDTLNTDNDFKDDIYTLKIGKTTSAFYSAELKTIDSLELRHKELMLARYDDNNLFHAVANLPRKKVFKNYPEKKIRVHDRFDLCNWVIDEDWEKPIWNITDSVQNILGYECILAYTNYRGRIWEAWFSPEIPFSDGPWKLCGLPGLILKAYDSKGHYNYTPLTIKTSDVGYVEYYDYDAGNRFKTTRLKGLQQKHKSIHEDIRYLIGAMGIGGVNNEGYKKRDFIPHSNYDFEETDYPHE